MMNSSQTAQKSTEGNHLCLVFGDSDLNESVLIDGGVSSEVGRGKLKNNQINKKTDKLLKRWNNYSLSRIMIHGVRATF